MKILCCLLLLCWSVNLLGQITYSPVFINSCNQQEEYMYCYLVDSNGQYEFEEEAFFESIKVPNAGEYTLYYEFDKGPITVEISEGGKNSDTILLEGLHLVQYVSSPPMSEYRYCDSLAQGKIVEYYYNGYKRVEGTFEQGQAVDSLFYYYDNGQLKERSLNYPNNWKRFIYYKSGRLQSFSSIINKEYKDLTYYENGQLKSSYDTRKNIDEKYYPTGQLEKRRTWGHRSRTKKARHYYPDGSLQLDITNRKLKQYSPTGQLIESMKRKETLVWYRLFAKDPYDRHNRWYAYQWSAYDSIGQLQLEILFSGERFDGRNMPFPETVTDISDYAFDSILVYNKGQAITKIEVNSVKEGEEWAYKAAIYHYQNNTWLLEKTLPATQIYELLATYRQQF